MRRFFSILLSSTIVTLLLTPVVKAGCPYAAAHLRATSQARKLAITPEDARAYRQAVSALDWASVKADIRAALTTSKEFWPADFGNYGPLMIRLAWHCAGSYRSYDGLGGCDGARQRFDPERSWPDNTNLNQARKLLEPIKEKYGLGLSWGDLIILTGNVAIESMGGPVLGFCAGRVDDADGTDSELLGPTTAQEEHFPCPVNGKCEAPLGANTVGLIYVNPEGPMGQPIPDQSALGVREVFGRMGMNDSETVALIGGGHAFGKAHGACPAGAGPSPKEDPANPWPGKCGTGKGPDTFTSGFEGAWTATPTKWSNDYFEELRANQWEVHMGPGGHNQWKTSGKDLMMLTTDVSLLHDPKGEFQKVVDKFASDPAALDTAFSHAWYKLTTRDMGPVTRCLGPDVPPAQPWQYPLPPTPARMADFKAVKLAIKGVLSGKRGAEAMPDMGDSGGVADYSTMKAAAGSNNGALFLHLAWQCASTFRSSDYRGGCNGARIRFSPEKDWEMNQGMSDALKLLEPVKKEFGDSLSWSDLIVMAGSVALEEAAGSGNAATTKVPFCGGRTDASDGQGSVALQSYAYNATAWDLKWKAKMLALTPREMVALTAIPRSPAQMNKLGYKWGSVPQLDLSTEYFTMLMREEWEPYTAPGSATPQYKAKGKDDLYLTPVDVAIKQDADLSTIAKEYSGGNASAFVADFIGAWVKVMNNDRFDGPTGNLCANAEVEVTNTGV